MFGRRRREEAAAEAAREAERRALFARLAERPENVCPFLGLADDRAAYIDGVSDEHRCFAFGDPTPLSAEQQTRVCQEPGYGNCPRYLRGVLVIPTEELEALRRRPAAVAAAPPTPPVPVAEPKRRRRSPILLIGLLVLLLGGAAGAWALLGRNEGTAVVPSTTPTPTATVTEMATPSQAPATEGPSPSEQPSSPPNPSEPATPKPEPTPEQGDTFAFYEVSVAPGGFTLFELDEDGHVTDTREAGFNGYSFARVEPREGADGGVYWETQEGALTGLSYRWPDSGQFRIRAVFVDDDGGRRSQYLTEDELTVLPSATPAPAP
ncbi:MAG: hypothetical protein IT341_06695 [Chloroflexi bacterium]|nr:hypothetical protein [Chloroflexota bacterium]